MHSLLFFYFEIKKKKKHYISLSLPRSSYCPLFVKLWVEWRLFVPHYKIINKQSLDKEKKLQTIRIGLCNYSIFLMFSLWAMSLSLCLCLSFLKQTNKKWFPRNKCCSTKYQDWNGEWNKHKIMSVNLSNRRESKNEC